MPLHEGSTGHTVTELRERLEALGLQSPRDDVAMFGSATKAAVEAFQRRRGLPISGVVDRATWLVLLEAGHVLGSRPLEHCSPMLRGDDVADLQQRLCALGFDTDRVDGIFGGLTAHAVAEFQENIGLVPDGKAGPATIDQLLRLGGRSELARSVSAVRDSELLRSQSAGAQYKVIGLSSLGVERALLDAIQHELVNAGLTVHCLDGDERTDPAAANSLGVDLYLGISPTLERNHCRTLFYSGYTYESVRGKALAAKLLTSLPGHEESENTVVGMALPLLRETLMIAVLMELPFNLETLGGVRGVAMAIATAITADNSANTASIN